MDVYTATRGIGYFSKPFQASTIAYNKVPVSVEQPRPPIDNSSEPEAHTSEEEPDLVAAPEKKLKVKSEMPRRRRSRKSVIKHTKKGRVVRKRKVRKARKGGRKRIATDLRRKIGIGDTNF